MQITRFHRIKNHRIFRDFSWPAGGLPDFGRFNLIYGWNGAGKTTLSNLFRHMQDKANIADGEVTVMVGKDRAVTQSEFATAPLPQVRVFNRDSIDRNIFEIPGKELPPVFYLGEDSVETQKQIESLKKDRLDADGKAGKAQRQLQQVQADFEKFCSDQARSIKHLLTAPGSAYNNYNAGPFKLAAERLRKQNESARLSDDRRQKHLATKAGALMPKIDRPIANYPDFADLYRRVSDVLGRSIVSSVIDELRDAPVVAQWVGDGLNFHRAPHSSDVCRFCNQPLSERRLQALEGHFNDAYSHFQSEVANLVAEVDGYRTLVSELRLPDQALLYPNLRNAYSQSVKKCSQQSALVGNFLTVLNRALVAKRYEPFRQFNLQSFFSAFTPADEPVPGWIKFLELFLSVGTGYSAFVGKAAFDDACSLIDQHNEHTDNFEKQLSLARRALEDDAIAEVFDEYRSKIVLASDTGKELKLATEARKELDRKIAELEKSIRRHLPAASELTEEMHSYLGRDELRFEPRDTGYAITRHGKPALHLSEGERTAIAFMYFLKSLEDTSFDLKTGVVVIDDPVSSLDANSLYCAFGFMKSRIQDAKQVFVLTHNFTFFRQVKNWFAHVEGVKGSKKPNLATLKSVRFYMLRNQITAAGRNSSLGLLDDLLYQYESEYHHLFQVVLDASKAAPETPMAQFYALPNSARRLLEAVFAFKQPENTGELFQQFKRVKFDEAKKARILRFTNTYSHHGLVAEPAHDLSVLAETPNVMGDVLALIQCLDDEHFQSMMAICTTAVDVDHAAN